MSATNRVGSGRVELHGGIAPFDQFGGAFGGRIRRDPEFRLSMPLKWIEIGISADSVVHPAADQSPDGSVAVFAENVPACYLKSRERAHHRQIRALGETAGIGAAKHWLQIFRICVRHMPLEHILDDGLHR